MVRQKCFKIENHPEEKIGIIEPPEPILSPPAPKTENTISVKYKMKKWNYPPLV